jgi:hypothetical protein
MELGKQRHDAAAQSPPPDVIPTRPLQDRVTAGLKVLAADADCADLAEGASDPEIAGDTVRQFMAHQLAAGHSLTMGLSAQARRRLRECTAETGDDEQGGRRSLELLRFVAGTARMMERCRAATIALDRIGHLEPPQEPDDDSPARCGKTHHYTWRLTAERSAERRRVLDWLAQGKKLSEMPSVDDWPPYHNPDMPDIEKLDRRLAALRHHAAPGLKRGRLKNSNPVGDYMKAPRCGAQSRAGTACRQPAMHNGRCRFHGGKSTGPRTAQGLQRSRTSRLTHGFRTAEIIDLRRAAARVGRNLRDLTRTAKERLTASPERLTAPPGRLTASPLLLSPRKRGSRDAGRGSRHIPTKGAPQPWTPASAGEENLGMAAASAASPAGHVSPSSSAGHISPSSSAGHGVHRSDSRLRWMHKRRRTA